MTSSNSSPSQPTLHFCNRDGYIYATIYYNGKQKRFSTRLFIPANLWDNQKELPRTTFIPGNIDVFNVLKTAKELVALRSKFYEILYSNLGKPLAPNVFTPANIARLLGLQCIKKGMPRGCSNMFTEISAKLYNDNVKESTSKQRKSIINKLKRFFAVKGIEPNWESLNLEILQAFFDSELLSAKTLKANQSHLRVAIAAVNIQKSRLLDFIILPKESRSIGERKNNKPSLNQDQIGALKEVPLQGSQAAVRDIFVFQCLTGLRISEVARVARGQYRIIGEEIVVEQKKTRRGHIAYANAPILSETNEYLQRIQSQTFLNLANIPSATHLINNILKEIAKNLSAFRTLVPVTYDHRGRASTKEVPQWKLLTSHIGRHTFVSNMHNSGVPKEIVIRATGHTDTKMLDNVYLHADSDAERRKAKEAYVMAGLINNT